MKKLILLTLLISFTSSANPQCYYYGMKYLVDDMLQNAPQDIKDELYSDYYRDDQLADYAIWLDHYSSLDKVDPWASIMFLWEQSKFRYDAVSMHNTTKPHRLGEDDWRAYNWANPKIGLDWGIAQFHCPGNMFCDKWNPAEIPKFLNPELSMGFLTEWIRARMLDHSCAEFLTTKKKCFGLNERLTNRPTSLFISRVNAVRKYAMSMPGCKE